MLKNILFILMIILSSQAIAGPPIFVDSYEQSQKISKDLDMDVLIIFSADWCKYCDKLKKDISNNLGLFNDQIIYIVDHDNNSKLVKAFKVKRLHQSFRIKKNVAIKKLTGYQDINKYIEWYKNGQ